MGWKVMVGAEEKAWTTTNPIEPPSEWVEAWDEFIPGYRARRFATETEANAIVSSFRTQGFSAATELED